MVLKRSKYNAKKITNYGIIFDSKAEADYYEYLKNNDNVDHFTTQPEIILVPSFTMPCGTKQRAITYTADFKVWWKDGRVELIDIKGYSPEVGNLKRKMYNALQTGIPLRWVSASKKHGDEYGFVDYDELKKKRREAKKGGL